MVKIFITRHGETKWNIEKRLQGALDSELTEKGVANAIALGERLKNINFHAIHSSTSQRAFHTAQLISSKNKGIPIIKEENLREISFGDWEGLTSVEIETKSKDNFSRFWNASHLYDPLPHQAESLSHLRMRVQKVIDTMITSYESGSVLIVTHAVVIRILLNIFEKKKTFENMWDGPFINGTSLTIVNVSNGKFEIELIGDDLHVKGHEEK
ncbi:histidine phosphatase family protein [Evansella cellulosilytica]|uniref:Phosphoglycerate mutase n=1 Tax=Evansella cellulosilytica (strain ATCC 21833 / DSM 2522 / FERM P-1141 / JCM 9156 / N-4) TaxID=649639 RepID=E6TZD4_EVAC2|nr:histidine phosphatase family protein [Evansella cellulosilytica]ADU28996.1 Phosphoglycerate mutase [Evansella cellulosilytica DSM 2522]